MTGNLKRTVEPDLAPEVAKQSKSLRPGWTTGSCATAAAKAATIGLVTGKVPESVTITLPKGQVVAFTVEPQQQDPASSEASFFEGRPIASAVVVKDAGDDPDCTHGARIRARVCPYEGPFPDASIELDPALYVGVAEGIGTVTKPGLGLEVGKPAINPVPRQMIAREVREVSTDRLYIELSVPGGLEMARQTTNDRLGIEGGISILGTTGIVKPFSTAAYRASVVQQIQVAARQGETQIVLSTGYRSETCAMAAWPNLDKVCFVEVGDFIGIALRKAVAEQVSTLYLYAMAGKITKIAGGIMMTHYHRSNVDTDLLARVARESGADPRVVEAATSTNTARHFFETCLEIGELEPLTRLCEMARESCSAHASYKAEISVFLVDYEGTRVIAKS